jgi:hypothetical protein
LELGHLRDDEGYTSTWFDEEAVSDQDATYYYTVVAPVADSYLYFTAESFYQHTIPDDCKKPESIGKATTREHMEIFKNLLF